jgi:hypothetical protein
MVLPLAMPLYKEKQKELGLSDVAMELGKP